MILRKPYAFLIKNFKLIHLVLTLLLSFVLYRTNKILTFLNGYLKDALYPVIDNAASLYIPWYLYLIMVFVISIGITILILMNKKEKPTKFYLALCITYFILIIGFVFVSSQLGNIEMNNIDVPFLTVTRDLTILMFLSQITFLIIAAVRAVGFNIKKFNFQKDLIDLEITSKDNEEFEIDFSVDSEDIATRFRRRGRIISYVFRENKLLLLVLLGIGLILTGVINYNTSYKENRLYKENQSFKSSVFKIKVLSSYQVNTNSFGTDITDNKYSYTIVKFWAKNISSEERILNIDNFILYFTNNDTYKPNTKLYGEFLEFGKPYKGYTLSPKEEGEYMLVFKIDKKYEKSKKILEYILSYRQNGNEREYNLARINLVTKNYENNKLINKGSLGNKLALNDSLIGESSIKINSFEIENKFPYEYKQCVEDNCKVYSDYILPSVDIKANKSVMKIDMELLINDTINNKTLQYNFLRNFGHIRYVINGKEYNHKYMLHNITPNFIDDPIYIEVQSEIKKAEKIYLDIIIRDKKYTYTFKEE